MRVFLDTNVLVSAFATRGLCEDVMREVLLHHRLVLSSALLKELKAVLKDKVGLPRELISQVLEALLRESDRVASSPRLHLRLRHENDVILLADALHGEAGVFITGDKEVLALKKADGMKIMSPRMFWEELRIRSHCKRY